jgi:hypothetical protein
MFRCPSPSWYPPCTVKLFIKERWYPQGKVFFHRIDWVPSSSHRQGFQGSTSNSILANRRTAMHVHVSFCLYIRTWHRSASRISNKSILYYICKCLFGQSNIFTYQFMCALNYPISNNVHWWLISLYDVTQMRKVVVYICTVDLLMAGLMESLP